MKYTLLVGGKYRGKGRYGVAISHKSKIRLIKEAKKIKKSKYGKFLQVKIIKQSRVGIVKSLKR